MSKIETTYGSDEHGLVWGYRFPPGQPGTRVSAEEVIEALSNPEPGENPEFFWLHFSLSNVATERWLRQKLDIPESFFESLHSETGSTRLEQDADSLVAVIHDVLFDSGYDASAVATAHLYIDPRLLISARRQALRSIDELRAEVRSRGVFRSPVELLAHLLGAQADVLSDILRKSTNRVDQIEDGLLANRLSAKRSELGSLRRVLVRLQRLLAPEPAALFRLLNRPPDWILEEDIKNLQQAAEEFSAAVADTVALVERLRLVQEELAAHVNEQTNRTLFILTVVTVLALPINLVAGLFGMNVGGIPLGESVHGFSAVAVTLLILTGFLAYFAFGRGRD